MPPEGLNSKEVLAHLNSLGYNNISPQQLKEFIHDLKKLIKYEQKQNLVEFQTCETGSRTENSDKLSSNESILSCESSQCSSSATYRRDSDDKADVMLKKNPQNPSNTNPKNAAVAVDYSSKKIRDPVSLYHEYSKCWKKLGVPGENKHNDLRWMIRRKLMANERHSRPLF